MIQRIQSVYLALVAVLAALTIVFPISTFTFDTKVLELTVFGLQGDGSSAVDFPSWGKFVPVGLAVLLASSAMVSVMNFKNRAAQLKLNSIGLLLNLALLGSIFVLVDSVAKTGEFVQVYQASAYFPVGSALLLILSNRAIRADEKKIKAADRLR